MCAGFSQCNAHLSTGPECASQLSTGVESPCCASLVLPGFETTAAVARRSDSWSVRHQFHHPSIYIPPLRVLDTQMRSLLILLLAGPGMGSSVLAATTPIVSQTHTALGAKCPTDWTKKDYLATSCACTAYRQCPGIQGGWGPGWDVQATLSCCVEQQHSTTLSW